MSMKKTDLAKNQAAKIEGAMKAAGVPGRFGQGAATVPDKREQRRIDSAAGLVPFACKLPSELAKQVTERGAAHPGGLNAWLADTLRKALA
jgi:hypothetical protein